MSEVNSMDGKFADVPIRVRSWIYIIVLLAIGVINQWTMTLFVVILSFQGMKELLRMLKPNVSFLPIILFLSLIQFAFLIGLPYTLFVSYTVITILITLLIVFLKWKFTIRALSTMGLGIAVLLISFGTLAFVRNFEFASIPYFGLRSVLFVIVVTELNDVFQYLSGKFFGKRPIVPRISPNKTVEGFIGGVILTTGLSNLLGYCLFSFYDVLTFTLIGIMLGVLGFLGDVTMSYLKRKNYVKDTGTLIPGHGGLLDRMDSLLFNAPAFYLVMEYLLRK